MNTLPRQARRLLERESKKPAVQKALEILAKDKAQGFPNLRALKLAASYQPKHTDPLARAVSR
jgi:hypothetical protein